jgi:NitT/TauT family transport system substrate-binding protein
MGVRAIALAVAALAVTTFSANAQDVVKLTVGQRGNWDTAVAHIGEKVGIFKKHGIALDVTYTSGSGETLQPVIAGSVDVGIAVGTMGALAAYSKGAPVRIIGAEATGAADYWYAKADSGIKSLKDTDGKTIAFSTKGSSTNSIVLAFIKEFNLKATPTATGNPPSTLTAVMTDQVDVGWAAPPFGLREIDEGKIRLIARATDASIVKGQTIRVIVTTKDVMDKRKDVLNRFMQAYGEAVNHMYASDDAIKEFAEFNKIPETMARRVRDEFFPKEMVWPGELKGLDTLLPEAVSMKFIPEPLTPAQQAELIQILLKK